MRYLPHTDDEIAAMLERIGVGSIDALFEAIPEAYRLKGGIAIPEGLDEQTLMNHLRDLAERNQGARHVSFLGGGAYAHHIPPAVDQLLLRSEFYTAYTPYQAELSQGTLQAIFEFQTLTCELFALDVANASMYDGASATAEAVLMSQRIRRKSKVLLSAGLHPDYRAVVRTYLHGLDGDEAIGELPLAADGRSDLDALESMIDSETAAVVLGYPNFFGCVEDLRRARTICDTHGVHLITATAEPYALAVLEPPGALGVDIAVGEGQALALPPQLGGPGVGLFACRKEHLRQLPGRLVGETVDQAGARGFVLTLSTREQHIRRERATSNICTNHGLVALAMTIRAALLGRSGFEAVGKLCLSRSEYLKAALLATGKVTLPHGAPTFNEFVVRLEEGDAATLLERLASEGVLGGIDLGRFDATRSSEILIAVTERNSRADLDRLVELLAAG